MRFLLASIFCFLCSCAHLWNFNGASFKGNSTTSSSQSFEDKSNASANQSKQPASGSESTQNSKDSELLESLAFKFSDGREGLLIVLKDGRVFFRHSAVAYKGTKILDLSDELTCVTASSNGLFAAAYAGIVDIYDLNKREKVYSLNRVKTRISSMEFSPDGSGLIMAGVDGVVYRWRFEMEKNADNIIDAEKSLERYVGHSAVVNIVRYHPFGRIFVSSDWNGALNAWLFYNQDKYQGRYDQNIFSGRIFAEEGVNRARGSRKVSTIIEQMRFSDDGQFLFCGDEKGLIELFGIRGFKHLFQIEAHKGAIYDMRLNPQSDRLITLSRDGKLKNWQVVQKESKLPGTTDYELTLIKEWNLSELNAGNARKIYYLNNEKVLFVNRDGSVFTAPIA